MEKNSFPAGWDEEKIKKVVKHYETQSDEDAAVEDDAAFHGAENTVMEIPKKLVPQVRELLVRKIA